MNPFRYSGLLFQDESCYILGILLNIFLMFLVSVFFF